MSISSEKLRKVLHPIQIDTMHFRFKPRRNPGSQSQHRSVNRTAVGHAFERLQDTGRSREIQNAFFLRSLNDIERILETLNWMNARPWRSCNKGEGLTERDLVKLTNLPLSEGMGVHAISCDNRDKKVRKHFPNLYPTRNEATECKSICDAVAAVLPEAKKRGYSYRNILRAWKAYRDMI